MTQTLPRPPPFTPLEPGPPRLELAIVLRSDPPLDRVQPPSEVGPLAAFVGEAAQLDNKALPTLERHPRTPRRQRLEPITGYDN